MPLSLAWVIYLAYTRWSYAGQVISGDLLPANYFQELEKSEKFKNDPSSDALDMVKH